MSDNRLFKSPVIKVQLTVQATGGVTAPPVAKSVLERLGFTVVSISERGLSLTRGDGEGSMKPYRVTAEVEFNVMAPNKSAVEGVAKAKIRKQFRTLTLADD
jgi:hypothetical protein